MGIERKVDEKWTCDFCGQEITDKKEATIVEVMLRGQGIKRKQYVIHTKELNQWWQKETNESII